MGQVYIPPSMRSPFPRPSTPFLWPPFRPTTAENLNDNLALLEDDRPADGCRALCRGQFYRRSLWRDRSSRMIAHTVELLTDTMVL
jgi:hypothetical protein